MNMGNLQALDRVIFFGARAAAVALGLIARRREKTSQDHLLAGGQIRGWAAAIEPRLNELGLWASAGPCTVTLVISRLALYKVLITDDICRFPERAIPHVQA